MLPERAKGSLEVELLCKLYAIRTNIEKNESFGFVLTNTL